LVLGQSLGSGVGFIGQRIAHDPQLKEFPGFVAKHQKTSSAVTLPSIIKNILDTN